MEEAVGLVVRVRAVALPGPAQRRIGAEPRRRPDRRFAGHRQATGEQQRARQRRGNTDNIHAISPRCPTPPIIAHTTRVPNAMTLRQRRRFYFVLSLLIAGAGATGLALFALQDNVLYFYSPSDVYAKHVAPGVAFRIGGLVARHSVQKGPGPLVRFVVSDGKASIPVTFRGDLPALFAEGGGVVAIGSLAPSGVFEANQVLAKHDEKYMPPEVVDALKRSGRWQETGR